LGINQYLSQIWPDISRRETGNDTWGDEVECQIIRFEHKARKVSLSLKQKDLLAKLPDNGMFHPEFARYMIETTPLRPYTGALESLVKVESNLYKRRRMINKQLNENEKLVTLSVFPMLGTEPLVDPDDADQPSINIDSVISDGQYSYAKENIEARSNRQADIRVPVFRDKKTKLPPELYLNHILFGPGGCGLQATFQCKTLREARILHDQLVIFGPVFLALTAATPVYHGVLVDTDVRWNQTASAVDDRAEDELSQVAERWSTAPMYLKEDSEDLSEKLDHKLQSRVKDDSTFLQSKGMDPVMASYFAHLHLRDPLYLSARAGKHEEVTPEAVHKSICASVWSHVRLKIPESNAPDMGWRVEFRPMEVQLTDFANAAFLIFLDLVRQMLVNAGPRLDLWMPLDLVNENMNRAHARDAVRKEKMWFPHEGEPVEMSIDQIVNGNGAGFPGLLQMVEEFLDKSELNSKEKSRPGVQSYLDFIRKRASGEEPTPAQWMRRFIQSHGDYAENSVVTDVICYDMLLEIAELERIPTSRGANDINSF
jgi:glutamate--cysteine ligase catalytic subunit